MWSVIDNTTLVADLTCTVTPGLIIGADEVTVNLNGFTLSGADCGSCHGIRNSGFDKVTIKNGTIVGFEQGIRGETVSKFTIKDVNLTKATSSSVIDILDSEKVSIKDVTIFVPPGAPFAVEAIRLESVEGVKVDNVDVDGGSFGVNFACFPCPDPNGPTNGVIKNSTFVNNLENGIFLADTSDARVENNVVTGSGWIGILVGLEQFGFPPVSGVTVKENTVSDSGFGGSGIRLDGASDSKISENTITGNAGNGITLIGSTGNKIEKNAVSSNGGDGINVDITSTGNKIEENTANGNTDLGYRDATAGGGTLGTDNTYEDNRCLVNGGGGASPSGLCVPQP